MLILHHPSGSPLKLDVGSLKSGSAKRSDSRVIYRLNTEPGSGGSPCFDLSWRPLAIHQSKTASTKNSSVWDSSGVLISEVLKSIPPPIREIILGIDKLDSVLLQNGRVLLNRKDLRTALREMLTVQGRKILIVNGPRGSGKTYTKEFIYHITQDIPNTKISTVNLHSQILEVSQLIELIGESLGGWTMPSNYIVEQTNRAADEFAGTVLAEAFRNPGINRWLIIDNFDLISPEVAMTNFIYQLLSQATANLPQFRIILIGFQNPIPAEFADKILVENIAPIEQADVEDFFARYFKSQNASISNVELKSMAENFLESLNDSFSAANDFEEQKTKILTKALYSWLVDRKYEQSTLS